jgi:hypothetical protein
VSAGYSGTPLARKLGIKEGHLVAAVDGPDRLPTLLEPLPSGVRLRRDLRARRPHDVILLFVRNEVELRAAFARARGKLTPAGGLWISWPKQSSPLATDLKESHVRAHGLSTGLVDNKVCAVDENWSGLRFVVRLEDRAGPR